MVRTIFDQRVLAPQRGQEPDEERVETALGEAAVCLKALEGLLGEKDFLTGGSLSLADLHTAPMLAYFHKTPEGRHLVAGHPGIARWWAEIAARPSLEKTRSFLG